MSDINNNFFTSISSCIDNDSNHDIQHVINIINNLNFNFDEKINNLNYKVDNLKLQIDELTTLIKSLSNTSK